MKKLLHEQLRDGDGRFISFEVGSYGFRYHRDIAEVFADEIEKYYIPRPRFEDGEPVQFGDKVYYDENRDAIIECIEVFDDGSYSMNCDQIACIEGNAGEPVKRPAPKVLDADGVEIKVGDTVYTLTSDIKFEVLLIDTNFDGETIIQTDAGRYKPNQLTHKEPDNLERIISEMQNETWNRLEVTSNKVEGWINRLSALIKRGA